MPARPFPISPSPDFEASRRVGAGEVFFVDPPQRRPPVKVLCVHGVNHQEGSPVDEGPWREAISRSLSQWGATGDVRFVDYNEEFAGADLSPGVVLGAVATLTASAAYHGVKDKLEDWFGWGRARGFGPQGGLADTLQWTAGMVVEWAGNEPLRTRTRNRLAAAIREFEPTLVLAHSLGSLVAYDTLARPANVDLARGRILATFGSQIGHPAVRSVFGGRLVGIPGLRRWFHLFNRFDHVFTAPVDLRLSSVSRLNFSQHRTDFDKPDDALNHAAEWYVRHDETISTLWRDVAVARDLAPATIAGMPTPGATVHGPGTRAGGEYAFGAAVLRRKPQHRALLVGLADYADPRMQLEGCVNDAYLMSSLLQEGGFDPANIRMLLNQRATTEAIQDRLRWLLDGAEDGQERIFYFAGHGAQIPGYGTGEVVDHLDECLVPYDFDWSRERAVVDDELYESYSQLAIGTRYTMIFDCCHSGGLTRDGSIRARGLTPPDDIRHRILQWDAAESRFNERLVGDPGLRRERARKPQRFGREGNLHRLGCAAELRLSQARFNRSRKEFGHVGPFMPTILQACAEQELAYEYRNGSQSQGAFTWFLAQAIRQARSKRGELSWSAVIAEVRRRLASEHYAQQPQLVCPTALAKTSIPWLKSHGPKAKAPSRLRR